MVLAHVMNGTHLVGGARGFEAADGIDDLSLDRIALAAEMRHMHRERAITHGLGAALGEFIQQLIQRPTMMRA
jgi:hypothetical protein